MNAAIYSLVATLYLLIVKSSKVIPATLLGVIEVSSTPDNLCFCFDYSFVTFQTLNLK